MGGGTFNSRAPSAPAPCGLLSGMPPPLAPNLPAALASVAAPRPPPTRPSARRANKRRLPTDLSITPQGAANLAVDLRRRSRAAAGSPPPPATIRHPARTSPHATARARGPATGAERLITRAAQASSEAFFQPPLRPRYPRCRRFSRAPAVCSTVERPPRATSRARHRGSSAPSHQSFYGFYATLNTFALRRTDPRFVRDPLQLCALACHIFAVILVSALRASPLTESRRRRAPPRTSAVSAARGKVETSFRGSRRTPRFSLSAPTTRGGRPCVPDLRGR